MFYKVLHGEIKPIENYNINRAFHYGDGFFESIYAENLQLPLFEYHYNRICKSFEILRFDKSFLPSSEGLYDKIISTLIQASPLRIRLDFTREAEGLYLPERNEVIFTI
jgi:branched-subunit amino acid aminotransferase/4-amino-4-deoxychorismate lyase